MDRYTILLACDNEAIGIVVLTADEYRKIHIESTTWVEGKFNAAYLLSNNVFEEFPFWTSLDPTDNEDVLLGLGYILDMKALKSVG